VEPKFSNAAGTVSFGGGSPAPFTGKKTILSITFKGLKEGEGAIAFASSSSSVLAADGKGTNALTDMKGAKFTIAKAAPKPEPVAPKIEVPILPIIHSATHQDPEKWYKENTVKFAWDVPATVDSIKTLFDESPRSAPTMSHNPPTIDEEMKEVADGVHYFHVVFRNVSGSGTAAHRKVMIDKTPPLKFDITQKEDSTGSAGVIILQWNATDTASGIDRYEVVVDGGKMIPVALSEVSVDGYKLPTQDPGEHTVKVFAFDKAGNSTDSELKFSVVGEAPAPVKKTDDEIPVSTGVGAVYWIILGILLSVCVFFGSRMYSERRRYMNDRELLKRETDEVGEKLGKVFSVLRDEVEEQVHTLSNKPNFTDTEREILEKVKDALDMSEEILDKEVEDIKKLLR
jgi:hypothetical protein